MTVVVAAVLALVLAWLSPSRVLAAPKFPALSGRVVDQANVLPEATRVDLTAKLEQLQVRTSRQLVVVTIADLQGYDIADYGYQLGRAWGIGQKGTNNGVLFITAPRERKTRIEVGYGLEPILTDALSSVILNTRVLPKFKAGDMPGGIVDGTNALIDQLSLDPSAAEQRAAAAADRAAQAPSESSGGVSLGTIITILVVFLILTSMFRGRRRRGGGGLGWWPLIFLGGGGSGGGGGGSSWGGGGGGGFSGGGGSFGGGGSSGSW